MIALRALAGVCAAVAAPQVWAAIPQLVPPGRVVAAMAAPTAGLTVAQLVGVPVGSLLGAVSTAAPFLAVGAAGAGTSLALWLWYPPVPPQASKTRVIAQYGGLLAVPAARWRFAAYFVFQLGNFAVLSFAPTWFSTDFALDATGVGYAMIALGTGNTLGALAGPRIVARWGTGRTLLGCMLAYLVCYPALPWSGNLAVALAVLSVVFFTGGTLFPVFMGLLQSLTATARGTVSALANVLMYAGSAVAGALGGPLMTGSWGFAGIACLVWTTTACSTLLWARSGAMR